ncbi:putative membrane protein [[Clostridium] sordellii ATCC 9714]|nr:putative membrane protein [[Clostridium] sordellii ATCC 9714] [Paeniclostridium sordellii ATCC 9714]
MSFIDKDKEIKWNFKDPDNIKAFIKSRFKVPIVSILMLILISIIIKCILGFVESDINKYLNVFNILMGINLVPIDISSSSNLGFGKININLGIILWIIIPAICITISSIIFIKKDEIDKTNILKETLIISIIYGAFIAFVSVLGKRTISLSMNEYYNLSIILRYSLCKSFINGILVCFIPTYITLYNKVKPKENIYKIINKVLKTIGTLLIIILITLIVCFVFNKLYLNSKGIMTLVMLVQISTYIIHLANLIPMIIINSIISIF